MTREATTPPRITIALACSILTTALIAACGASNESDDVEADLPDAGHGGSAIDGGADSSLPSGGFGGSGGSGGSGGGGMGGSGGNLDTDVQAVGPHAEPTTFVVHAAAELFPFRLCVEAAGTYLTTYPYPYDDAHHLPETNFPGIDTGGAVAINEVIDALGTNDTFTLHAVRADIADAALATPTSVDPLTCSDLLEPGLHALESDEFVTFENLDRASLVANDVRVLTITGCLPGAGTQETCGPGFDLANGNVNYAMHGFSPTLFGEPTSRYIFPAHVSPPLATLQGDHSLVLQYGPLGDASARETLSVDVPGNTPDMTLATIDPPDGIGGYATTGFVLIARDGSANDTTLLSASLADVQRISAPYDVPDAFFEGADAYVLMFVGDPSAEAWLNPDGTWNPAYDGRGLHVVALPFTFNF